eukprot:g5018.t1
MDAGGLSDAGEAAVQMVFERYGAGGGMDARQFSRLLIDARVAKLIAPQAAAAAFRRAAAAQAGADLATDAAPRLLSPAAFAAALRIVARSTWPRLGGDEAYGLLLSRHVLALPWLMPRLRVRLGALRQRAADTPRSAGTNTGAGAGAGTGAGASASLVA